MTNIDLTPVVQAVIGLCAAIVTAYIIPLIEAHAHVKSAEEIQEWAAIGVLAAEQIYKSGEGVKKLLYVQQFLESKGFKLDRDGVEQAIEAAVYEMNNAIAHKENAEKE